MNNLFFYYFIIDFKKIKIIYIYIYIETEMSINALLNMLSYIQF
jgi:hypothetical protein